MAAEQSIQPLNVAAATLLIQLMFVAILGVTSTLYQSRRWAMSPVSAFDERLLHPSQLRRSPTTLLALGSFALLLISDELYSIWSPLFQGVGINTISARKAIFLVFVLNLGFVGYLVAVTGGSRTSPFLSALFTVPALAIFLRLPPSSFLTFAGMAAVIYVLLLTPGMERQQPSQKPAAFMNLACLFLSIFTGYITRPVPINELPSPATLSAPSRGPSAATPVSSQPAR
jgi:hypothetical protein